MSEVLNNPGFYVSRVTLREVRGSSCLSSLPYAENYLENVDRTKRLLSAILAIVLWPLVLVGFDVKVT